MEPIPNTEKKISYTANDAIKIVRIITNIAKNKDVIDDNKKMIDLIHKFNEIVIVNTITDKRQLLKFMYETAISPSSIKNRQNNIYYDRVLMQKIYSRLHIIYKHYTERHTDDIKEKYEVEYLEIIATLLQEKECHELLEHYKINNLDKLDEWLTYFETKGIMNALSSSVGDGLPIEEYYDALLKFYEGKEKGIINALLSSVGKELPIEEYHDASSKLYGGKEKHKLYTMKKYIYILEKKTTMLI